MNLPMNISFAHLPATYEAAKPALAECQQADERNAWSDKASTLEFYARLAEDDELEKIAMRLRGRSIRRI
ncbi:MAG: hypothetical protein HRU33_04695 [Rhodobacteraceae bacterium]|nr:hypothetical protein [Paracoccaceae bacterium]